ncbi:MAG: Mbeg1-like protein [bacterium]
MQGTIEDLVNMCYFLNGENGKESKHGQPPQGWEIVDKLIDNKSGFLGYTFKKDNNVVVCYKGTDFNSAADWFGSDLSFLLGRKPPQYTFAKQLYLKAKEKFGKDNEIMVSGTSLGGGLAELLGTDVCKDKVITFNPVGTHRVNKAPNNNQENSHIFNIVIKTDVVGNLFKHHGNVLYVDGPVPINNKKTHHHPVKPHHGLKNRLVDSHLVGNFKNFVPKNILKTPIDTINILFNVKRLDIIDKSPFQYNTFPQKTIIQKPLTNNPLLNVYQSGLKV